MQGECPCSPEASAFSRPGVANYLANYLYLYVHGYFTSRGGETTGHRWQGNLVPAPSRGALRRVISMLDNAG